MAKRPPIDEDEFRRKGPAHERLMEAMKRRQSAAEKLASGGAVSRELTEAAASRDVERVREILERYKVLHEEFRVAEEEFQRACDPFLLAADLLRERKPE